MLSSVMSVHSALTHLLTTSGPRGTFSRLSTTLGCISIIELLQFSIVRSFWASLGKALFEKACHQAAIKKRKSHNCVRTDKSAGGSKLIEQTLNLMWCMGERK